MIQVMSYTKQVIHEVLRLRLPGSRYNTKYISTTSFIYYCSLLLRVGRECDKDNSYKGFVIKKVIKVQFPIYIHHHLGQHYSLSETFNSLSFSKK